MKIMRIGRFSNNTEFKHMLEKKQQEILSRTNDGVQETRQFQQLLSLLTECRRKNKECDYRLILISKTDLCNLCSDAEVRVQELFHLNIFLTNRTVRVDSNFSVLSNNNEMFPDNNNDARRHFTALSNTAEELIVFHIAPNATINYFIDGRDYGNGVFYTLEAQNRYEELKPIEQLEEVLDEYRINLTRQETYLKFFVPKAGLRALRTLMQSTENEKKFLEEHKHLLNNKPEELFREDMRKYIKQHMRVVENREHMLEDLDRLDIILTDEMGSDLYFIEVKWVGESIHNNGQKLGTEYRACPRIRPEAIKQVLGYIDKLLAEKKNVKIGYLAVFDARKEDKEDTGKGIKETDYPENLQKYFPRFFKLPDFRVKNINPR
ncbi:hypothetical protein HMPREF9138_01073 [Prevotella histicola F0411]|uniref:Uncharacterized protein n=2 Tax=Prevotella histicola TaxID=470565 RepID=G6AG46_9BACT|nr:hypothetical protein HMPREF9138_01073 [Prevotella histicola F0411]